MRQLLLHQRISQSQGPQTEIAKIAKVSASAELDSTLNAPTTTTANIVLYDKTGNKISTELLTMEFTDVEATISVLPEKDGKCNS